MFCASVLFLFLFVYISCYAKNLLYIRQQDIEFTKLMQDLDDCDQIEKEYKEYKEYKKYKEYKEYEII